MLLNSIFERTFGKPFAGSSRNHFMLAGIGFWKTHSKVFAALAPKVKAPLLCRCKPRNASFKNTVYSNQKASPPGHNGSNSVSKNDIAKESA